MIHIIEEYLVSLGFKTDKQSFNEANKAVGTLEKIVNRFQKSFADNKGFQAFTDNLDKMIEGATTQLAAFAATAEGLALGLVAAISAAVLALGTIITVAVYKFMANMSKADMQVQLFARRMFTTVENARSLKAVMDQMGFGSIDDLKDIALNPELRAQFLELRKTAAGLGLDTNAQQGMRNIRALTLEFQKMGILMNYFWTTLAGDLGYFLQGPLADIQKMLKGFNNFLKDSLPGVSKDLTGLVGIFAKLIQLGVKLATLWMRIPFLGKAINLMIENFGYALDIVNALLDAMNRFVDKTTVRPSEDDIYKTRDQAMKMIAFYVKKISDGLSAAWQFIMTFIRPVRDWITRKVTEVAQNPVTQGITSALFGAPAEASTMGKLSYNKGVRLSPLIKNFLSGLEGRLSDNYTVTAGQAIAGHLSHGNGRAVDIGLAGKSDASILSLLRQVLSMPTVKVANLELTGAHYKRILEQAKQEGLDTSRIRNDKSKYSHGDHLHVGLRPLTQQVSIHISGAGDPKAVAMAVQEALQQQAMLTTRTQQGSFA